MHCSYDVIRFVHRPYNRPHPDHGHRVTETQPPDYTRCYRVLAVTGPVTERVLSDVTAVATRGDRDIRWSDPVIRYFSFGAEDDLDRYLLWLTSEALVDSHGTCPRVVVAEQWSYVAQSELRKHRHRRAFVHPGCLGDWGVLAGSKAFDGRLALY